MISTQNIGRYPAGVPLVSDDVVEYHAARLLLLLHVCGTGEAGRKRIDGLTKLAKLDFFVRYPEFFARAARAVGKEVRVEPSAPDTKMIRYHYGPWDQRYYQVLPFLEARGLVGVRKDEGKNQYKFILTPAGTDLADRLDGSGAFDDLVLRMKDVRRVLGRKNGNQLKELIYSLFEREVADLSMGDLIS